MLTRQDCIGLSELSEAEVTAIAEHEHVADIIAAEIGNYLVHSADSELRIRRIILDDIDAALSRKDLRRAAELRLVLQQFCRCHPDSLVQSVGG
ncbi:MAG: hypothetical protein HYR63_01525 [Proteobacteria bacterium]|nr:hypothetical protein [Pseudomonadota bacterium]